MTSARLLRPAAEVHPDPLAGRLLGPYLVSLLLHALLLIGFAGGWLGSSPRSDSPPVYHVDLVHKPVLNPQAGRPEPRTTSPEPSVPKAPAVSLDKATVPLKNSPTTKAKASETHLKNAFEQLRDEQARQSAIERLRQKTGQTVPAEILVGMPNAKGTEKGVSTYAHVQTTLQKNWALSSYLLSNPKKIPDIEAWVRISYSKSGGLEGFHFEKESGETQFDESIKRALMKSQQLSQPLPEKLEEVRVIFNLKALIEGQR